MSLRPLRKQGWFARATRPHRADEGQDDVQTLLLRRYPPTHTHARPLTRACSNLWSTFYEVVDDTSQIAKAHGILAESLQTQLLAPLDDSIRAMEAARRRVLDEAQAIGAELQEAASVLRIEDEPAPPHLFTNADVEAYADELTAAGTLVNFQQLEPTTTARSVRESPLNPS